MNTEHVILGQCWFFSHALAAAVSNLLALSIILLSGHKVRQT